ncbi:MAG: dephospho-CoA kinase [Acutalibacteraceae bacterium]|nr:dephospho-CoA kinase [Acutalibacteraceae bacterium]
MKYVLGLTGPTGSGKSTLGRIALKHGWYVIDCDQTVKAAYKREDVLTALSSAFGDDILSENKEIIRPKLAEKAFSSKENTELLNKTVLPFIFSMIKEEINKANSEKILLDAPTLYESGADKLCNAVCALLSKEETRFTRITARDSIDEAAARLRMSAGKDDEYYKSRTPYILYNDLDEKALEKAFLALTEKLGGN